jgi:hypothetical protein
MSDIPDARDGLTRLERVILWQLDLAQKERRASGAIDDERRASGAIDNERRASGAIDDERGGASVPTALLYGRVVEHVDVSVDEFQRTLQRLIGQYRR